MGPSHLASLEVGKETIKNDRKVGVHDDTSEELYEPTSRVTNDESRPSHQSGRLSPSTHELADVRFDIRRCWRDFLRTTSLVGAAAVGRRTSSTVLGCEVQCRLALLTKEVASELNPVGTRTHFALWWDAADQKLNSYFEAPLPCPMWDAADKGDEGDTTTVAAEWSGRIVFSLRVETGLFESSPVVAITGEAVLSLDGVSFSPLSGYESRRAVVNFDVPIRWNRPMVDDDDSESDFPQSIPLQLSFELSAERAASATSDAEVPVQTSGEVIVIDSPSVAVSIPDLRRQLVPAEIALSLSVLHVSDLKSAFAVRVRSDKASSKGESLAMEHLNTVLTEKERAVQVMFDIVLRHESQLGETGETSAIDTTTASPVAKRWRTSSSSVWIADGNQDLSLGGGGADNGSNRGPQAKLRVLPDQINSLKSDSLEVKLLVICDECNTLHEVGTASIPTAPVLFRPNGIQGSFPLRVGKGM